MSDARTELVFAISTASFACNQVLAMQRSDAAQRCSARGGRRGRGQLPGWQYGSNIFRKVSKQKKEEKKIYYGKQNIKL